MITDLIKKTLKDSILEAIRSQKEEMKNGKQFVPYTTKSNETNLKNLSKDMEESERVKVGKEYEQQILNKLTKYGTVEPSSTQEDIKFKLDGFFTPKDPMFGDLVGKRVPVQIKKRSQSGDDILFEIERDFDHGTIGRDQKGNSTLYVVSDRSGKIGIFKTERLKKIVNLLLKKDPQRLEEFRKTSRTGLVINIQGDTESSQNKQAQLQVTKGNSRFSEGDRKLIAFISFDAGSPIAII